MKNVILATVALVVVLMLVRGCGSDEAGYNGTLIYEGDAMLAANGVAVHKLSTVLETPDTLIVEVHYTYNNEVPADEVRVSVEPDMDFAKVSLGHIEAGEARASQVIINTHSSSMINGGINSVDSHVLNVNFDRYVDGVKQENVYQLPVVFEKTWEPKAQMP